MACIWGPTCFPLTSQIRSSVGWFVSLALWWGDKSNQKKGSVEDKSVISLIISLFTTITIIQSTWKIVTYSKLFYHFNFSLSLFVFRATDSIGTGWWERSPHRGWPGTLSRRRLWFGREMGEGR